MPFITAVNGAAAGVGISFALMGDLVVVCARSGYFLQAFRRIGLVPDGGSTWILPRLVGRSRAIELSMMGEKLPAEKALEWGLIYRVVDDAALMSEARKLAGDLADGPTVALGLIRKLYWESDHNSYEEQLNLEARCNARPAAPRTSRKACAHSWRSDRLSFAANERAPRCSSGECFPASAGWSTTRIK